MSDPPEGDSRDTPPLFSAIIQLAALCGVLMVYLAVLAWLTRPGSRPQESTWLRLLVPNLWLLCVCGAWLAVFPSGLRLLCGGRHAGKMSAVLVAALLAVLLSCYVQAPPAQPAPDQGMPALLMTIILVAAAEELFFRGVLLGHLRRSLGDLPALGLVSVLFGFLHFPQGTMYSMTFASMVLCLITLSTGSVLWAFGLHLAWNALAVMPEAVHIQGRWYLALASAATLVLVIAFGLATREKKPAQDNGASPGASAGTA